MFGGFRLGFDSVPSPKFNTSLEQSVLIGGCACRDLGQTEQIEDIH